MELPLTPLAADDHSIADRLPEHIELLEKLGEGSFATVYRVRNKRLQTDWALKVFKSSAVSGGHRLPRVLREAQIVAKAKHPNIAMVHDVDPEHGFILMELIDGGPLKKLLDEEERSWTEFRRLAEGILSGLAAAHAAGIIHSDLSPANILLTGDGTPKLVDFGLARHVDFSFTSIGATPGYASPEHIRGKEPTFQSDVFCAGQILFQLATGYHPFEFNSFESYQYAILNERPREVHFLFEPPSHRLEQLLLKATAREQKHRYPSATEMLRAFQLTTQSGSEQVESELTTPGRRAWKHYERGLEYYSGTSRQDMDWAEEEFRKAIQIASDFALAYVGLADVTTFRYMSYFDRSVVALAKAEHYCRQALDFDSNTAKAYRSLGRIYMERHEFAVATEQFKRATTLDPDFLEAYVSLGWCHVAAHELTEAEESAKAARAIAEDELEPLILLARIYYYQKEYERSIAAATDASSLNRRSGRAYYDLAMAHRALGGLKEARENFKLSSEFHGDPNTPIDWGILEIMDGRAKHALSLLQPASGDPTFGFLASYYLGLAHQLESDPTAAQTAFEQSVVLSSELARQNPTDPYPKVVSATAHGALGNREQALANALIARELDPKDGLVCFYAACARSWSDKNEAATILNQALTLPRSPSRIEADLDPHFRK